MPLLDHMSLLAEHKDSQSFSFCLILVDKYCGLYLVDNLYTVLKKMQLVRVVERLLF